MKKKIFKFLGLAMMAIFMLACKKEEKLNVDLTKYNIDNPVSDTELDEWIRTTFLAPYNMDVIYRYNRYYYDNDKYVAPTDPSKIKAQMQTVLDGFITPYSKVAGATFIKRTLPKEWVLFGSPAYLNLKDNTVILASAAAGRRITLYSVNDFNENDADAVTGKLRTIQHEYTHILNQLVKMPVDFKNITAGTYDADWTEVPDATARDNGYVSPYASSSDVEDFAETVSMLLVRGQAWFDDRANASTATGKAALKEKEASIVQYFNINLGIDFRKLQQEIQNVVRNRYKYSAASFPYWMNKNLFKTMTIDLNDGLYAANGISSAFETAYNELKAGLAAKVYNLDYIQLRFESSSTLTVRMAYSRGNYQSFADYSFTYSLNGSSGQTTFKKATQGTGTTFNRAKDFETEFASTIEKYLTNKIFIADWLPATIGAENFNNYGGFYLKDTPDDLFYGSLGQTL